MGSNIRKEDIEPYYFDDLIVNAEGYLHFLNNYCL